MKYVVACKFHKAYAAWETDPLFDRTALCGCWLITIAVLTSALLIVQMNPVTNDIFHPFLCFCSVDLAMALAIKDRLIDRKID